MAKSTLFSAASLLSLLVVACGDFSGQSEPDVSGPSQPGAPGGPKAPPVDGKPVTSDLVESLGVFVTEKGVAGADGTRARPFGSIQAGIDAAKQVGKRVYVCAGSYAEALTIADSISVIGGLDCSQPEWKVGAADARSRLVAPKSPAITARQIVTATKIAGFDVVAPNATEPGGSSIGLLAEKSPALVVASSSITAGNGAKGADGVEGIQLVQTGTLENRWSIPAAECNALTCKAVAGGFQKIAGTSGATSVCQGADGHDGESGGDGGSGGLWRAVLAGGTTYVWEPVPGNAADLGGAGTGAAGAAGTDGVPPAVVGTLGPAGYVAADGNRGSNGQPGKGGAGGAGGAPNINPATVLAASTYRGESGAGGGAGGCPGLAGDPGQGGGASIAVALVESPISIEDSSLIAGAGGASGLGALGSTPRRGGALAGGATSTQASGAGGNGGVAGTSSNGSAGPSFGIAHVGAAPTLKGSSKAEAGKGGAGVEARTKPGNGVSTTTSIAATPEGLSEAVHAF
ncbi:MAG: hypothetical protein JST00_45720 [Deltaproteobacteria bacterium]|nr:hypothetical protein [Deltaproteobacteria bacterium]